MSSPLAIVLLLLPVALLACGDSDSPFPVGEALAAAQSSLLTVEDFPEGWTKEDIRPILSSPLFDAEDTPPECELFLENADLDHVLAADQATFFGMGEQSVESGAAVFESEEAAAAVVERFRKYPSRCEETLRAAFRDTLESIEDLSSGLPEIRLADVEVTELALADYGNESAGVRLTMTAESDERSVTTWMDVIVTRADHVVGGFHYTSTDAEPDQSLEDRLLPHLEARVRAADASLRETPRGN